MEVVVEETPMPIPTLDNEHRHLQQTINKLQEALNNNSERTPPTPKRRGRKSSNAVIVSYECNLCNKVFSQRSTLNIHLNSHTNLKSHACVECGKAFKSKGQLISHQKIHLNIRDFSCPVCDKKFIQKANMKNHLALHTGERPFECPVCQKRYVQNGNLQSHLQSAHFGITYKCDMCPKEYKQKSHLEQHLKIHVGAGDFKCNICEKAFVQKASWKHHMATHEMESGVPGLFHCPHCPDVFYSRRVLLQHSRLTHGESSSGFACPHCEKVYQTPAGLAYHIDFHNNLTNYSCNLCDKTFKLKMNVKRHVIRHLGSPKNRGPSYRNYTCLCEICGVYFSRRFLSTHIQIVHNKSELNYECEWCQQKYIDRDKLKAHVEYHHANESFPCCFCGKVCISYRRYHGHVRNHFRVGKANICNICRQEYILSVEEHIAEKHPCVPCNLEFTSYRSWYYHQQDHKGKAYNKYFCEYCGTAARTERTLQDHMKLRHSERPFQCPDCSKSFLVKGSLVSHMKHFCASQTIVEKVEEEPCKPYPCPNCPKAFQAKNTFVSHVKYFCKGETEEQILNEDSCEDGQGIKEENYDYSYLDDENSPKTMAVSNDFKLKDEEVFNDSSTPPTSPNPMRTIPTSTLLAAIGKKPVILRPTPKTENSSVQVVTVKSQSKTPLKIPSDSKNVTLAGPSQALDSGDLSAGVLQKGNLFGCENCNSWFDVKWKCEEHVVLHPKINYVEYEGTFSCNECSEIFTKRNNIISHIRQHIGVKKLYCELCNMHFPLYYPFLEHFQTHYTVSTLCEDCGQTVGPKKSMTQTYVCVCDARFIVYAAFKRHLASHVNNPRHKFMCGKCKHVYNSAEHLQKHMVEHRNGSNILSYCAKCGNSLNNC